jgi:hypothetical protein
MKRLSLLPPSLLSTLPLGFLELGSLRLVTRSCAESRVDKSALRAYTAANLSRPEAAALTPTDTDSTKCSAWPRAARHMVLMLVQAFDQAQSQPQAR